MGAIALTLLGCGSKPRAAAVGDDALDDAGGTGGSGGSGGGSGGSGGSGGNRLDGDGGIDPAHPEIVSRGSGLGVEAETHVAIASDGSACVSWIAITASGGVQQSRIGYRCSTDGGLTWLAPASVTAPSGREASDPVLAVGKDGAFRLAFIGFHRDGSGSPTDMAVYVATAASARSAFGAPVVISDLRAPAAALVDKPWIVSTEDGRTIVSYATDAGALVAASTSDGATWTRAEIAPAESSSFRNLAYVCAAPGSSRVHVVYWDATGSRIFAQRSDDGANWGFADRLDVSGDDAGKAAFHDPSCAASGSKVFYAYGLSHETVGSTAPTLPSLYAVRVARSDDQGATIAARIDAHDTAAGVAYALPHVGLDAAGRPLLAYLAGVGEGDRAASLRLARSSDAGPTFSATEALHTPLLLTFARSDVHWVGDYLGVAADPSGALLVSYVDNVADATGSHVAVHRAPPP